MKRMTGFGEKSVTNILNAIETSCNVDLPNFLYSLGVSAIGRKNSQMLCDKFDYDLNKIRNVTFDQLIRIDGIGDIIANEILSFFANKDNNETIDKLLTYISFNEKEEIEINNETSIAGKSFVVTGDLVNFKNRKELEALITQNGGINKSGISKLVDYLINNDSDSDSSKNKKAKELGIPIISEEQFLEMIK